MELLVVLVVVGLGVGVTVDDLDHPLSILELHLLLIGALTGNVLLAFLLAGRRAVVAGLLLLLLVELLYRLLDLSALPSVVVPGVVHWAPQPTLIAARGLAQLLVTTWITTPTSHCCDNVGSGSACQRLVVGLPFLPILVLATALSSGICFGLAVLPCR
jgi:hypothetical protein